jgi:hypothetical protein
LLLPYSSVRLELPYLSKLKKKKNKTAELHSYALDHKKALFSFCLKDDISLVILAAWEPPQQGRLQSRAREEREKKSEFLWGKRGFHSWSFC